MGFVISNIYIEFDYLQYSFINLRCFLLVFPKRNYKLLQLKLMKMRKTKMKDSQSNEIIRKSWISFDLLASCKYYLIYLYLK